MTEEQEERAELVLRLERLQQQLGQARELLAHMRRDPQGPLLRYYADRLAAIVGED